MALWGDRYGITAQRVAVRAHTHWIWRVLGAIAALCMAVALGAWLFGAAKPTAPLGDDAQHALQARVDSLEAELAQARAGANVSESAQTIESTTRDELVRDVKRLQDENVRLKEELALFERLESQGAVPQGLTINGFQVEADALPGQYRYRALVAAAAGKAERETRATLQIVVALRRGEQNVMMILPGAKDADRQRYELAIRHFRRVDGLFQVPEGARPVSVEMRLMQDGALRASWRLTL